MNSRSDSPIDSNLRAWFNNLPIHDPVERRMALLLQVLLLGLMAVVILATILLMFAPGLSVQERLAVLRSDLIGFSVVLLPQLLLRRGYFHAAALMIITVLMITPALAITFVFGLPNSGGVLFQFTLAIILSGLLLNRRVLTIVFGLSAALVVFSAVQAQTGEPDLARLGRDIAVNFVLFNGLIALFLDRFGITLRTALVDSLVREREMQGEITNRKDAEMRFRLAIESAPNGILLVNTAGQIILVNSQAEKYFGYSRDALIGMGVDSLVPDRFRGGHPDHRADFLAEPQARPLGFGRNLFARRKDGSEFPVEIGLAPIETSEGTLVMATIVDITERKQADARFRLALESAPNAILMINQNGQIILVNPLTEKYFGYSREELIGKSVDKLIPERIRGNHAGFRAGFFAEPQARLMGIGRDLFALRKDGTEFPVEIGLAPIDAPEGMLVMATIVDITERKQAQEVLQESEERYRTLFESIDQGFCTIEVLFDVDEKPVDYRFLVVNPAFERQTGIQDAVGRLMREIAPLHEEHWFQIYGRIALTGESMRFENPADQLHRYYDVYAWKVGLSEERKVAILFNDITERKRAEERQQFLANASKSLASSLDYETTLTTVAQLAVPKIADWCTVYLTAADGSIEQVALTHANPEKVQWARELQRRFPTNPNAPGGVAQVIRSGKAEFMPEIPAELLEPLRKDPEISKLLDELQLTGAMTLPLTLHGQTLGAISLVSAESRLRYTPDDLELAEELARRIVVAVENARLYHTAKRLNEDLELRVIERTAELSQANALLNAMMDNVPDHIFFKDRESRFLRNSRSQAEKLGLNDPAEVVGKSDFDFFPHAQRAFDEEQEIIRSGQPIVDEEEHVVWPDGRETWVSTTKVPLRQQGGEIVGIFGIARDITERKQAEQSLKLAKEQVEAANKELEAFSYSVSHDLRAPLRAINGYTRMLLEDYEPLLDEEGKRLFDVVRSEAQRMGELIDDLLTFSRLGRTEMRSVSIDMAGMARKVFDELTKPETRARIDFHLGKLPPASGDPALIHQVWVNLISNAIKFTSKKDQAVIRVSGTSNDRENIYGVNDNGAGFDLEYVEKLFGVFQRLHSESEFEGTGVGLAIVQRVILRHGGRVWAEGEVDKGATFHFSLPRQGAEP